ncbi:kanamycin kinase [Stackebrandtia albiflava]|uniref:Kanamycin kinase n=1 Tax=Stackebrandtia albiflava TaxID=406432 RepID=A0A562V0R0_9ACTN|nr:hypothetical protein [Stackebrandtia albiflava]TWJ11489.1 kanamycin kinase [Stackebrandtia albiflava]
MVYHLIGYDERLRMVPTDRAALDAELARIGEPEGFAELRAAGLGRLLTGEYEAAAGLLDAAYEAADTDRRRLAVMVNRADVTRYAGDPAAALPQYRRAVELARASVPELLDFALQHLGKCLAESGETGEAGTVLHEALALRLVKGDPELVASTRRAIELFTPAGS